MAKPSHTLHTHSSRTQSPTSGKKRNAGKIAGKKAGARAQLFSLDSIIAVIIFLVLLASMIWASEYIKQKISEDEVRRQLTLASGYALSALIETPGQPSDWNLLPEEQLNESALLSLGLALSESQPWQLDSQKLARLQQISASKYSLIKTQLAMRGPNYDYQLKITSPLQPPVIIGIEPASDAKNIIVVSRLASLNSSYANLTLMLWEK